MVDRLTFSDLLDHPDLYLAYPQLAKLAARLVEDERLANGAVTAYRSDGSGSEWIEVASAASNKDLHRALLYEAQLAINRMEGW